MKQFILASLCSLVLSSAFASVATPWRFYSDPSIMNPNFERKFENLPLTGAPADTQKLWANDYWALRKGNINYRWNSTTPKGFDLVSPNKAEALTMSTAEIAALAPSEKLDILNGNFNYPLKKEVAANTSPRAPLWHGICNGWAPAAINHREPLPKTLISADGIAVPFGSSDIKALVSYYYAFKHDVKTYQMGRRCNFNIGPQCGDDLNAGAFHIVLTNRVGLDQESFVADVERGRQVWNHAINRYATTVVNANLAPSRDSATGTKRRVHVKTVMSFVLEIKKNSWEPTLGTDDHVDDVRNYEYILELDGEGKIIGGEWISAARPDFIWTKSKVTNFEGQFARISELLND
jgi:hypothetical protein